MKKYFVLILICCALLILDNTLTPYIAIRGYYPSILLVFVVCYSLLGDIGDAVFIGVFSGILQDLYFYNVLGVNASINLLTCSLVCYLGRNFIKERIIVPITAVFGFSIFKGILIFLIMKVLHINIETSVIIFRPIYNMIITVMIFSYILKLSNLEFMKNKWGFKE